MSDFEARRAAQNHAENAGRIVEATARPKLRLLLELVSSVTAGLLYVGDAITEATARMPKPEGSLGFRQFPPGGMQAPADRRLAELTVDEIEALERRVAKSVHEKIQAARGDGHGGG